MNRISLKALPLLLAATAAMGGCGGSAAPRVPTASASARAHFLSPAQLRLELGNGFRRGLYRLAVMSQPADSAVDLNQDLPTGTLAGVSCAQAAPRPSSASAWLWHCGVRWRTVDGAARTTRYRVTLLPTGCFAAGATPRFPQHRDTTIESFAEHPLNALASYGKGC